jgi:multiple sugar transport system ATP-binding protein
MVFDDGTRALEDLSLHASDGELLVLVGPSGCGKSTALRLIAGLELPSAGRVLIGGREVTTLPPQSRNVAMVFQNYALYPHMSVRRNLEFPLRMAGMAQDERARRVREAAAVLDLDAVLERRPRELSGGQRQRVAMGRAIVREPDVFLMDEPLSNLDARLRVQIRAEIAALQRRLGVTTVYVTHDQVEAMTLGQRVAVLNGGRLQQLAPPGRLYDAPANTFVAGFVGSPPMNLVETRLTRTDAGYELLPGVIIPRDGTPRLGADVLARCAGARVIAGIRPEALAPTSDDHASVTLLISAVEALGHETIVYGNLAANAGGEAPAITARLPGSRSPRATETLRMRVEPEDLYLFDPASGETLARCGT